VATAAARLATVVDVVATVVARLATVVDVAATVVARLAMVVDVAATVVARLAMVVDVVATAVARLARVVDVQDVRLAWTSAPALSRASAFTQVASLGFPSLAPCSGESSRTLRAAALRATVLRGLAPARILDSPCARRLRRGAFAGHAGRKEGVMLRIYETVIEVLGGLRPMVAQIEASDRDLARQLRRAASSIALNVQEGSGSRAGTRRERYCNALGSARETGACLDVAVALGYVERVDAGLLDRLDKVRAVLVKNVR
jgi:four helix bundle protein